MSHSLSDSDRLAALQNTSLLDTPPDEAFDRLTRLASTLISAPVALVSLVDANRQYFKSCIGLPEPWASQRETPLSHSFCQHAVTTAEPLIISDARDHPLVRENLAIRDLHVIAYAGIPLITSDGHVLGSFCVIDSQPRDWQPREIAILKDLAASVMTEIELRQMVARERDAREAAETLQEQFRTAAARLSNIDRRKTQFLATLAHELRNPLAALTHALEVMGLVAVSDKGLCELHELMDRQLSQMEVLISDLMDMSRIVEGKLRLQKQPVHLQEIVEDAVKTVAARLADAGHELIVDLPDEAVSLRADPSRLLQVVTNLLNNACKYTPNKGRIELRLQRADAAAVITVTDNGIGIAPQQLSRIFELFGQVDESKDRRQGGIGIGLPLVRQLVQLHGGSVTASSPGPGQGSQFTVQLPMSP